MQISILGCSGGIGENLRTTSLLIDDTILIDMGTGVGDLSIEAMQRIDTAFLTHSHLDHIATLPLMLDSVGPQRDKPLLVYAQQETLDDIKTHIFNNRIWPDFTQIPSAEAPFLEFKTITPDQPVNVDGKRFQAIPVNHTVPAAGYLVSDKSGSLAFTGDTAENTLFWEVINACADLKHLIVEASFADKDAAVASLSRHLRPETFVQELKKYTNDAKVWVTHMMPGYSDEILSQIQQHNPRLTFSALQRGDKITL